ncbi:MAG: FG-GAP-like repeat-containing protein [Planctomycetota bacterium]
MTKPHSANRRGQWNDSLRTWVLASFVSIGLASSEAWAEIAFGLATSFPSSGVVLDQCACDFDGDGDLDLVTVIEGADDLEIQYGFGPSAFFPMLALGPGPMGSIAAGDLDGNGTVEFVAALSGADQLAIFSSASGSYQWTATVPTASEPGRIALADFDQDGDLDIAVTLVGGLIPSGVQRFNNVSGVGFVSNGVSSVALNPMDLQAVDITEDGKVDLVVSSRGMIGGTLGAITVLEGLGTGNFALPIPAASGRFGDFEVADLTGDGHLDVVAIAIDPSQCANSMLLLSGAGGGMLLPGETVETPCGPVTLTVGDFDHDGTLDLLAADGGDLVPALNMIFAFRGLGNGAFQGGDLVAAGDFGQRGWVVGDFDENGTRDLAFAGYFGGIDVLLSEQVFVPFLRGDANDDGVTDLSDAVFHLGVLFVPGSKDVICEDAADVNDDGQVDVSDPIYLLGSLFIPGSPPLPAPSTGCGIDPTDDPLECDPVNCP